MTLETDISLVLSVLDQTSTAFSATKVPVDFAAQYAFSDDQANAVFFDAEATLALNSGIIYDLSGGIVDAFGNSLVLQQVKAMAFKAPADNATDLQIGGGSFASWLGSSSDFVVLRPGGSIFIVAPNDGYAVTPGTGDQLEVTNPSLTDAATFSMLIIGKQ